MKKVLFLGATGIIAKSFFRNFEKKFILIGTYSSNKIKKFIKFDVLKNDIKIFLKKNYAENVIIAIGNSNHDYCALNKKSSRKLNVLSLKKIINECVKNNQKIIFLSSQMIFDGISGNYTENSLTNSSLTYAKHKIEIEEYLKKKSRNFVILRLSKVYGSRLNDNTILTNFYKKQYNDNHVLKLADDQIFNPVYDEDVSKVINQVISKNMNGIFNIGGPKKISRYHLILECNKIFKKKVKLKRCSLDNFDLIEKHTKNTSFDLKKLKKIFKFKFKSHIDVSKIIIKYRKSIIKR